LWEDVKMKKAFTLIELLVVIAIIAILAAMLMPALNRARYAARVSACQHNIHNVGLGLSMLRQAKGEEWPRAYYPDATDNQFCNVFGRLVGGGYIEDSAIFACPVKGSLIQTANIGTVTPLPTWWPAGLVEHGNYLDILCSGFGYDNGRIGKNANPAREIVADIVETAWRADSPEYTASGGTGQGTGVYTKPNHSIDSSANVLFVDNAVRTVEPQYVHATWKPDATNWPDLIRRGFVQNPRMDVGEKAGDTGVVPTRNGPDIAGGDDFDDMYLIDDPLLAQRFSMLNNDVFEQYGARTGDILAADDAAIAPERNQNHQTGWPQILTGVPTGF
jgi:prepilin-type N-terminal cleavage/methylation domain-containing protein